MAVAGGPRRADARRNRGLILEAARAVFAEQGIASASLNDVARRAGVGPGTLWRHFAGRDELAAEVVGESLEELAAAAERSARDQEMNEQDPGAVVCSWAAQLITHILYHRGLAEELAITSPDGPLAGRCRRVEDAADELVERARSAGRIAPELSAGVLIQLCTGVAWTVEQAIARGENCDLALLQHLTFHGLLVPPQPYRSED